MDNIVLFHTTLAISPQIVLTEYTELLLLEHIDTRFQSTWNKVEN